MQPETRLPFTLRALQDISDRIHQAPTLDRLLDAILETLEKIFGFRHSMLLLASDQPDRLEMIASRGYPEGGVGSEVRSGEGIIGLVAEATLKTGESTSNTSPRNTDSVRPIAAFRCPASRTRKASSAYL